MVSTLLKAKADVNIVTETGFTPLHCAVHCIRDEDINFRKKVVQELIEFRASVTAGDGQGQPPPLLLLISTAVHQYCGYLHRSEYSGLADFTEILLNAKVDVSQTDREIGNTALHLAAYHGMPKVAQTLMKWRASPFEAGGRRDNRTPLALAVAYGRVEIVQAMVEMTESASEVSEALRFSFPRP